MEEQVRLAAIENDHRITKETDRQFLFAYQKAILLSLKEAGVLDEAQYRYGIELLRGQPRQGEQP